MVAVLDVYTTEDSQEEPLMCVAEAAKQVARRCSRASPSRTWTRCHRLRLSLFIAPLRGWRRVNSYQHRTRRAWAQEVRSLLAIDYPDARQVKLVADNLNPHHLALLDEAFAAEVAHRLEIHFTRRHGSC